MALTKIPSSVRDVQGSLNYKLYRHLMEQQQKGNSF